MCVHIPVCASGQYWCLYCSSHLCVYVVYIHGMCVYVCMLMQARGRHIEYLAVSLCLLRQGLFLNLELVLFA